MELRKKDKYGHDMLEPWEEEEHKETLSSFLPDSAPEDR